MKRERETDEAKREIILWSTTIILSGCVRTIYAPSLNRCRMSNIMIIMVMVMANGNDKDKDKNKKS